MWSNPDGGPGELELHQKIARLNPFRYKGYYYDADLDMYYCGSRYYDPEVKRFINADGYVSTGQGILGNNMFAYCNNNPVMYADSTGMLFERSAGMAGWGAVGASYSPPSLSPQAAANVAAVSLAIAGASATVLATGALREEVFAMRSRTKTRTEEKEEEQADILPNNQDDNGTTYYHVTSPENAALIISSRQLVGSSYEAGYVYAWKRKPSRYAINNSGAHMGVILSFKTAATFVLDSGIENRRVLAYGPVVSSRPGPITIWDIKVVGGLK